MADKEKAVKPVCPVCKGSSTLGYLNGRNGKINYFCSVCSVEVTFDDKGKLKAAFEISADGSTKEIEITK